MSTESYQDGRALSQFCMSEQHTKSTLTVRVKRCPNAFEIAISEIKLAVNVQTGKAALHKDSTSTVMELLWSRGTVTTALTAS